MSDSLRLYGQQPTRLLRPQKSLGKNTGVGCRFLLQCPSRGRISLVLLLFFFFLSICLFLVALGLHCCLWAFSSCCKGGLFFVAVHGLLIAVASLVAKHGL